MWLTQTHIYLRTMKHLLYSCLLAFALMTTTSALADDKKEGGKVEIEKTDLVDTGTYQGTAHKVDPEEEEIYVKTDDGKILELYLKKTTEITKGSEKVAFDALKEGQKLEVQVENKGKKLKPIAVKIIE